MSSDDFKSLAPDCTGVTSTCPDPECLACGERECPMGEPMHFHHDGCPARCGA